MSTMNVSPPRSFLASVLIAASIMVTLAVTGYGVAGVATEFERGGVWPMAVMAGVGLAATATCGRLAAGRIGSGWPAALCCALTAGATLGAAFALLIIGVGIAMRGVLP